MGLHIQMRLVYLPLPVGFHVTASDHGQRTRDGKLVVAAGQHTLGWKSLRSHSEASVVECCPSLATLYKLFPLDLRMPRLLPVLASLMAWLQSRLLDTRRILQNVKQLVFHRKHLVMGPRATVQDTTVSDSPPHPLSLVPCPQVYTPWCSAFCRIGAPC